MKSVLTLFTALLLAPPAGQTAETPLGDAAAVWHFGEAEDSQQRHPLIVRGAVQLGVPREKLFAHGVGWKDGELLYDVPVNPDACPGWSFYALTRTLADPRCRFVCVFNWESMAAFPGIAKGIHEVVDPKP